jgi:hypothetical protein
MFAQAFAFVHVYDPVVVASSAAAYPPFPGVDQFVAVPFSFVFVPFLAFGPRAVVLL